MESKNKEINEIKKKLAKTLRLHSVIKAGVFGSFARGEAKKKSDLDILVKFRGEKSLFDLSRLEIELEKKIGRKVDLLTYDSIHPLLRERIFKEEVKLI